MDFSRSPDDSTTVIVIDVSESPSASVNGKSDVAYPVNTVSSVPLCVDGVEVVGKSLTAFTVIDMTSVSDAPESSVVTTVMVASVLSSAALVQVRVAIAELMLATVPPNVIVASSVPSPELAANVRPVVWARLNVPLLAVIATEVIEVSSTSAIEFPVIALATSSLTALGVPSVFTGASFTAA